MVQRFRFIAVAIVAVVAFTVILNVGNVHALPPPTVVFTPNPVPQGTDVVVTGSGFNPSQSVGGTIAVFPDASCGGLAVSKTASSDSSGNLNPVTFPTGAFAVGTHCVEIIGPLVPGKP